jgi:ATP-binding cassette subfamily F protein 3
MGANGSGKSTFAKVVLNQLKPLTGEIRRYFHLSMGILKQDIVSYQSEETLFKHFRNLYPKMTNEEIYSGLGRYAFSYADANEKRLCDLSGGELMRIEIPQLSLEDYDLLILDEPTNHLDMLSISELIDALNEYDGTLIIISHNRDFIDKTCDKLLYFYNKHAYYYEGNYESFRDEKLKNIIAVEKEKIDKENREKREEKLIVKREKNSLYNEKKSKTRLTRKSPEKILEKIDRLEKQKSELEGLCSLSEYYNFPEKLKEISTKIEELNKEIESLYKELEMAM